MTLALPVELNAGNEHEAIALVKYYLQPNPSSPDGVWFTGSKFDTWGGGGDRPEVRNRFTDDDLVALSMLSIRVSGSAAIEIVERKAAELSLLLGSVPPSAKLHDVAKADIGAGSPPWQLWDALRSIGDIGPTTASKLMARKRPALIPIWDSVVAGVVGDVEGYWERVREALQDKSLVSRLQFIGQAAGASELAGIRVLDIVCWTVGKGYYFGESGVVERR